MLLDELVKISKRLSIFTSLGVMLAVLLMVGWASFDFRSELRRTDYSGEVSFWKGLGEELGKEAVVAGIFEDYGFRPAYWGWMNVTPWQRSGDIDLRELAGQELDGEQNIGEMLKGLDYFIVADFNELEIQPQLAAYLEENASRKIETIYATVYRLP